MTRTIIGRDVRNCHPPKALEVVNQLIADLKAGVKDEKTRIMTKGTKIFVIRYLAVRDKENKFMGVLETIEEVSKLYKMIKEVLEKDKE